MNLKKTIYQVDAFTDTPFKGNPAGVMFVDAETPADWMQKMAMEMNLSETAFLIPAEDGYEIRYFTPSKEVPLCGHATLASAHIVYELGLKNEGETLNLKAKGADLSISKKDGWLAMNFPEYPLTKINIHPEFKSLVGFEPIEMYASLYDWVIGLAATEAEIAAASPNFEGLKNAGLGHLMVTAQSDNPAIDFVLRCFVPVMGIDEDPVTGSAHCALTPLWAAKTGKTELESLQISKRTGRLSLKLKDKRVEIRGQAVTIFKAELFV